jgi:organic radical activating enzyme
MAIPIDEIFGDNNQASNGGGTLQGEGLRMGIPSIFIRTGGCNLTCKGFGCTLKSALDNETIITGCDSIHAVNVKHFKQNWNYYDSSTELIQEILKHYKSRPGGNAEKPDLVFTGGEPLIHHSDPALIGALEYFISRGHKVYFETNGTQYIDFDKHPIYKKVAFSMSVKMSSSGEDKSKRWKPEVVNQYLVNTEGSYFKFVLSKESLETEQDEVFEFLDQVPTFGIVYCMPLGETSIEVQQNAKAVYTFAAEHGFRYSDRLHIRIFEDLRGV